MKLRPTKPRGDEQFPGDEDATFLSTEIGRFNFKDQRKPQGPVLSVSEAS